MTPAVVQAAPGRPPVRRALRSVVAGEAPAGAVGVTSLVLRAMPDRGATVAGWRRPLARVAGLIVEPRPIAERHAGPASAAGVRALVLGSPPEAVPLAGALAGALRARERAAAAVVCAWAPHDPSAARPVAAPWTAVAARRLAERLATRGLAARAAGRLVWLDLPAEPEEAARLLARVLGWLDVPVVTALAGPRWAALDCAAAQDLVVAVRPAGGRISSAGGEALTALALVDAHAGVACEPLAGALARRRARTGLARLPAAHPALAALGPTGRERLA